jgi:hypothetical protein
MRQKSGEREARECSNQQQIFFRTEHARNLKKKKKKKKKKKTWQLTCRRPRQRAGDRWPGTAARLRACARRGLAGTDAGARGSRSGGGSPGTGAQRGTAAAAAAWGGRGGQRKRAGDTWWLWTNKYIHGQLRLGVSTIQKKQADGIEQKKMQSSGVDRKNKLAKRKKRTKKKKRFLKT